MSIYIKRHLESEITESTKYFPVITLTGPRQSGKSTLLRHIFPESPYISLEDPDIRLAATDDPKGFLSQFNSSVILDEIQRAPHLLSYIQTIVDMNPERKFYLTGSSQFSLLKNVTQSLAGRTAVFELLPLSLEELAGLDKDTGLNSLLYSGFYPAIWSGKNIPRFLYPNYVKTYLERDVRDLMAIRNLTEFQRFLRLCAARIGSVFNASELANETGVSVNTINSWVSILQASYLIYLLPPFFINTRKRLTKSPKIYFTDTGLAAYLLDINSPEVMMRDKMRGHLFENMIIMNSLKNTYNRGETPSMFFYRDSNGNEVDLMVREGGAYRCIEIKSAMTYNTDFTKGLDAFERAFPALVKQRQIIYAGEPLGEINRTLISGFRDQLPEES